MRPVRLLRPAAGLVALAALVAVAGCGNAEEASEPTPRTSTTAAARSDDGDLLDGAWLLRFSTEGGAEGETTAAVYIRYTPSTGATTVQTLPGLDAPDTYSGSQAVLVDADETYALLDSAVTAADRRRGRLTLYPTAPGAVRPVDLRALTGQRTLRPVAAAFDPDQAGLLRVVDTARRVWRVDLVAGSAKQDGTLPRRAGWTFSNGFDKNSGLPYIADVDTTATLPPGNGDDDVRPVRRRGGVIRVDDGTQPVGEPPLPCGFVGGFTTSAGTTWVFCADTPTISAYTLAKGGSAWKPVGRPSRPVIPATASELPVVLPPVG
ncbi:MAG: hypothetical protein ACJ72D_06120 [Marmoricola sp.]